jgi:hypothetical protein
MKRRLISTSIVAALCTAVLLGLAGPAGAYSNDFNTPGNTTEWTNRVGTITQVQSLAANPGGYASGIASASGSGHARLDLPAPPADPATCGLDSPVGAIGTSVNCSGPFTRWGGYSHIWNGTYTTQVDIYLDAGYANDPANVDSSRGNFCLLENPRPADCKGTRFDYTSAINKSTLGLSNPDDPSSPLVPQHLRDFGFVVGTGQPGGPCTDEMGWVVNAQTNVNRNSAFPDDLTKAPVCISETGWYTFKHTFFENAAHNLEVLMEITPVGSAAPAASWSIEADPIEDVGCNRYGWFSNQEIAGLPIDNASMTGGCVPAPPVGKIAPTGTTCQQYANSETTPVPELGQVRYTTNKGGVINAVSPGVFFYYTKVSGDATHRTVGITESNTESAPPIPINQGQVVLYNASTCKVVKWSVTLGAVGNATGTLPSSGDFIVGVKYSPSELKGQTAPASPPVTYSFGTTLNGNVIPLDAASVDLVTK